MGTDEDVEACGRCSMTAVVGATDGGAGRDPFADGAIEVPESEARAVSRHVVALGRLKRRLNDWAAALAYGR